MKRYELLVALVTTWRCAQAGAPPHCEKAPCNMKSCQVYDKHGKKLGVQCSNDCSKQCCRCPQTCNRH
jgi:hypothetical protein